MKIKKKLLIPLIAAVILAVGVTLAFMFRQTGDIQNKFTDAEVECSVQEDFDKTQGTKTSITVKNKGNVDAYIRVRLVSYWKNADGDIVGKPSETPKITLADGWTADGANDTYYYNYAIAPNGVTPNLLKESLKLTEAEYNDEPVYQVVEVFAEAIQAEPSAAVSEAWHTVPASQS